MSFFSKNLRNFGLIFLILAHVFRKICVKKNIYDKSRDKVNYCENCFKDEENIGKLETINDNKELSGENNEKLRKKNSMKDQFKVEQSRLGNRADNSSKFIKNYSTIKLNN